MQDIIKKIGLFGIGVIAITQEKLEEFTQEMIKTGEMNKEEGKKFVVDVLQEKDRQIKEIGNTINQKVKEAIDKSGVATKQDLENIKERLNDLEKKL